MNPTSSLRLLRRARGLLLAGAVALLAGCATGPGVNPHDPLERFNRDMTTLNDNVDLVVLRPTATLYREYVPAPVRTGVSNFFSNLSDAWSAVNNLLQFKLRYALDSGGRFVVNTTLGLGGIIDIASDMNMERHREDFGQTLGYWGVPAGPYVVLPLLGPSTLRDTFALPLDWRGDPLYHLNPEGHRNGLYVLRVVNVRSNLLRASDVLDGAALDKYSFTRDAYLQRRRSEIRESEGDIEDPNDGAISDPSDTPAAAPGATGPAPAR
jgi:phospholipid-binding lipoprotein MlaA